MTMSIDFIQAANGKVDDFLNAVAYWEKKQSMAILGGTLTSQADSKSNTHALGVIHDKARREIMLHDVRQIEPTINEQLVAPIVLINGMFPADRMPRFEYDTAESVDQQMLVDVLATAASIGMEVDVDYAHQAMQIPRAKDGAKILTAPGKLSKLPVPPADAGAALARLAALARQRGETTPDAIASQLAQLASAHEETFIQQVAALVSEHGDIDSTVAALEQLATDPVSKEWVDLLARGMAAANLAGRSAILDQ